MPVVARRRASTPKMDRRNALRRCGATERYTNWAKERRLEVGGVGSRSARIGRHVFGNPDGLVVFTEKSAANEGKADRGEIARRYDAPSGPRGFRRRLRRVDAHAGIAAFDGALIDGAGCQNLRVGLEALEEAIEKLFADDSFPVRPRHVDGKHEAIFCVKATVYSHEFFEAADEETAADEQKKRQRHFTSDQNVAKAPLSTFWRSEEHTSELQSRLHLVCRLLLEKKKNNSKVTTHWTKTMTSHSRQLQVR